MEHTVKLKYRQSELNVLKPDVLNTFTDTGY